MRRTATIRRGCLWGLIGLAVAIALVPWQGFIWDGGFPSIECRLKFVDGTGAPVPGVKLTVLTRAGGECHFYPVDEFVPGLPITSDAEGLMVFHHSSNFLEFGGHEYSNLIGLRFGETSAPHYDCVFTLDGREVFRTPFNFHQREWDEYGKAAVVRTTQELGWKENKYTPQPNDDYDTGRVRRFDANGDGRLDREEKTAAWYVEWKHRDKEEATEWKFRVVERTIVVPNR